MGAQNSNLRKSIEDEFTLRIASSARNWLRLGELLALQVCAIDVCCHELPRRTFSAGDCFYVEADMHECEALRSCCSAAQLPQSGWSINLAHLGVLYVLDK